MKPQFETISGKVSVAMLEKKRTASSGSGWETELVN